MYIQRKYDLAVYYFIKDLFNDVENINIVDEFPTSLLTLPTISTEMSTIDAEKFELGNNNRLDVTRFYVDIFAKNKAQRDEYAYRLLEALEDCIPVYDYDQGNPPQALTQLGCLQPNEIRLEIIRILPELVDTLYYRSTVSFTASYSQV
jgi:hypothetical protein